MRSATVRRTLRRPRHRLYDGQPPATLEPARAEHLAPSARAHALHKAVLALARDALRLPRPLHLGPLPPSILEDYTVRSRMLSNTVRRCSQVRTSYCPAPVAKVCTWLTVRSHMLAAPGHSVRHHHHHLRGPLRCLALAHHAPAR